MKMENVRIDDRRIHVDFSQSVPRFYCSWMKGEKGLVRRKDGDDDGDRKVKRRQESPERERHDRRPHKQHRDRDHSNMKEREREGDRERERRVRERRDRREDYHRERRDEYPRDRRR